MKSQLKRITILFVFSFLFFSCDGSSDGTDGGLSQATLNQLADYLTTLSQEGLFDQPPTSDAKRDIFEESDIGIIDAVEMDLGQTILFVNINPDALQTQPIEIAADDLTIGTAGVNRYITSGQGNENDLLAQKNDEETEQIESELKMGVDSLLDTLDSLGINTENLRTAETDTIFQEEGDSVRGYKVEFGGSDNAITLPLGLDDSWGIFSGGGPLQGWLIIVTDGFSHTIFSMENSNDLRNGNIIGQQNKLTNASDTALHELIHTVLKQQGREDKDDDEDQLVGALERALVSKVNLELDREKNGTPTPSLVQIYSNGIGDVKALSGEDCLTLLGLPLPAGDLFIQAPNSVQPGTTFDVTITAKDKDSNPLAFEEIYIQINFDLSDKAPEGEPNPTSAKVLVGTDADGKATFQVAADTNIENLGSITINGDVLGFKAEPAIVNINMQNQGW